MRQVVLCAKPRTYPQASAKRRGCLLAPGWSVRIRRQRIVVRAILQDLAHEVLHVILSQGRSIQGLLECWLLQVTGRSHGEEQMLCLTPTSFGCNSGGGSRAYFDVLSIPRVIRPINRTWDMLAFPGFSGRGRYSSREHCYQSEVISKHSFDGSLRVGNTCYD